MKPDPRFPDRPTHPDLDDLSAAAIQNDARTDIDALVAEVVDFESLSYLAMGRAERLLTLRGLRPQAETVSQIGGAIMDGFMIGVGFTHARQPVPTVVVLRDPDNFNDRATFGGPVETFDIDLGYADLNDVDEWREWDANQRAALTSIADLDARAHVERILDGVAERHEFAERVVREYDEGGE